MDPVRPTDRRAWALSVRDLVRKTDPTAELCLDGEVWVIEVERSETREIMGVRVVLHSRGDKCGACGHDKHGYDRCNEDVEMWPEYHTDHRLCPCRG